ncbi:MAG TPA: hypothetical protein PLY66_08725, partial [Acidobacteriota bacterium]|nr:hypothetical protein [Acidobacteriota bacterium]
MSVQTIRAGSIRLEQPPAPTARFQYRQAALRRHPDPSLTVQADRFDPDGTQFTGLSGFRPDPPD